MPTREWVARLEFFCPWLYLMVLEPEPGLGALCSRVRVMSVGKYASGKQCLLGQQATVMRTRGPAKDRQAKCVQGREGQSACYSPKGHWMI